MGMYEQSDVLTWVLECARVDLKNKTKPLPEGRLMDRWTSRKSWTRSTRSLDQVRFVRRVIAMIRRVKAGRDVRYVDKLIILMLTVLSCIYTSRQSEILHGSSCRSPH